MVCEVSRVEVAKSWSPIDRGLERKLKALNLGMGNLTGGLNWSDKASQRMVIPERF